jgi:hypothetical protein
MAQRNYTVIAVSWLGTPLPLMPLSGYGIQVTGDLEDVTQYGNASQTFAFTGELKRAAIKFVLLYDDTASTGVAALFRGQEGTSGSLVCTTASGKTDTGTAFIQTTNVLGTVGKMTKLEVTLQPSGVWTIV